MKKILIAVDPIHLNRSTLIFGSYLARLTRSKITGVFLENLEEDKKVMAKNTYEGTYIEYDVDQQSAAFQTKMELVDEKIRQFKDFYFNHGIRCNVHEDKGTPIKEIIEETRFADLLILDAETSFQEEAGAPTSLVKRMLAEAECPVVIAPLDFEGIEEIIFAYNGSRSCMCAIKQFSDLFPQLEDKKLTVLEVKEPDESFNINDVKFKEWMQNRFANVHFQSLTGQTETELLGYLIEKKKVFIVMGAYGRSAISNFFRQSVANVLIKTIGQPIFIAHH